MNVCRYGSRKSDKYATKTKVNYLSCKKTVYGFKKNARPFYGLKGAPSNNEARNGCRSCSSAYNPWHTLAHHFLSTKSSGRKTLSIIGPVKKLNRLPSHLSLLVCSVVKSPLCTDCPASPFSFIQAPDQASFTGNLTPGAVRAIPWGGGYERKPNWAELHMSNHSGPHVKNDCCMEEKRQ